MLHSMFYMNECKYLKSLHMTWTKTYLRSSRQRYKVSNYAKFCFDSCPYVKCFFVFFLSKIEMSFNMDFTALSEYFTSVEPIVYQKW